MHFATSGSIHKKGNCDIFPITNDGRICFYPFRNINDRSQLAFEQSIFYINYRWLLLRIIYIDGNMALIWHYATLSIVRIKKFFDFSTHISLPNLIGPGRMAALFASYHDDRVHRIDRFVSSSRNNIMSMFAGESV